MQPWIEYINLQTHTLNHVTEQEHTNATISSHRIKPCPLQFGSALQTPPELASARGRAQQDGRLL
jgi:hypothetical protein